MKAKQNPGITQMPMPTFKNGPLERMITDARNPYHNLHVNKANELKQPKLKPFSSGSEHKPLNDLAQGNPWLMMRSK